MKEALRFALVKTIPVLLGYLFLGVAFGVVLQRSGYGAPWALLASTVIYAGSGQFVMADLLAAGAGLLTVAATALLVNSRHIFYGLTFVERFRGMPGRAYMIFSLTDETYSLLCALRAPEGIDENRAMLLIALLDQSYWVLGSCLGALLGQALPVDLTGIDFAMTALFTVILVEQVRAAGARQVFVMCNTPERGMDGTEASLDKIASLGADGALLNDIRMGLAWRARS